MKSSLLLLLIGASLSCNKEVEFASQSLDKVDPKVVVDQEFSAGEILEGQIVYQPLYGLVEETVTLLEKPPMTATLRQVERQVKVDEFTQGHGGSLTAEEFPVSSAGKLDLLIVVDNSESMETEQQKLASNLKDLTEHLKTTDWQIAVITTDSEKLRNNGKPIKASDATAEQDFLAAVNVGDGGSSSERGIRQAYKAFENCDKASHPWIRPGSSLAVFFLSDENDRGNSRDPDDLVARMKTCRSADQLKAYALTWTPTKCNKDGGETEGTKYLDVVSKLGGFSGSICDMSYSETLKSISKDVARSVQREFLLQHTPEKDSVTLEVDGQPYADFALDGRKVTLKNAEGTFIKLKIHYRHDPEPRFDRVQLFETPAPDTLQVFVDGAQLSGSQTGYDPATREVFFVDMPPDGAKVKVKYRMPTSLAKSFDFASVAPKGEVVDVLINGQPAPSWSMDDTTRVLTFDDPPADAATVQVLVRAEDSRVRRYLMGTDQDRDRVTEVTAQDQETGEVIPVTVDGTELVFDEADVADGRRIIVTYDYGDTGEILSHQLPHTPIDGSVSVKGEGTNDCIDDVLVTDRTVSYTCDASELAEVIISYRYVAQRFTSFEVVGGLPEECQVQVFVNGRASQAWQRDGNSILLPEDELEFDAKVRIVATVYGTRQ